MVKGLRSPEIMHLDLMRTYNATALQTFWKLRVPASIPFLFTSMKVAIAASLVGAIVGELPTGAVAGIGSKLLAGSYYSQTIDIWAALVAGSVLAAMLVAIVGLVSKIVDRAMGGRPHEEAEYLLAGLGRSFSLRRGAALAAAPQRSRPPPLQQ